VLRGARCTCFSFGEVPRWGAIGEQPLLSTPMTRRVKDDLEEVQERPSRTQRKREVEAINELGEQLIRSSGDAISQLGLDEELVDAVLTCTRLKKGARARQVRLVGKLLRARDHEGIRAAFEAARAR
jgi:ribosomal 50S subunit-associated protein YjgA (DUF615 family)